jgi:hypothetical protein
VAGRADEFRGIDLYSESARSVGWRWRPCLALSFPRRRPALFCGNENASTTIARTIAISENAIRDREIVFGDPQGEEIASVQYSSGKKTVFLDPAWSLLKHSPHEVGDQSEEHDQESRNPDQESGG